MKSLKLAKESWLVVGGKSIWLDVAKEEYSLARVNLEELNDEASSDEYNDEVNYVTAVVVSGIENVLGKGTIENLYDKVFELLVNEPEHGSESFKKAIKIEQDGILFETVLIGIGTVELLETKWFVNGKARLMSEQETAAFETEEFQEKFYKEHEKAWYEMLEIVQVK